LASGCSFRAGKGSLRNKVSDDYLSRIRRLMRDPRVRSWRVEYRRRHRALVFDLEGAVHTLTFPSTPSDWRGPTKFESDVIRILRGRGGRARGGQTPEAAGPTT
jgi:hypothetical protein